jgi:hypothetical protein
MVKADMKARVSNLAKTETEWSKLNFTPFPGELIVYTASSENEVGCARIKIGDGIHTLQELPFVVEHLAKALLENYKRAEEFDAGRITDYFN